MKKIIVGSSALACVLVAGFFAASTVGSAPRRAGVAASTTTSTPAAPAPAKPTTTVAPSTTTVAPTTTTTLKPKPVDPLAGAVSLGLHGTSIDALDANGHVVKHLVTTFSDRLVNNARLMGDHHTVWYETSPNGSGANKCSDIVRLDLASNTRTVIAHADGFSVSGNGERVALRNVQPDSVCNGSSDHIEGVDVVRDLATGKQSQVIGQMQGDPALSPGGHVLVATTLHGEDYDGTVVLTVAMLPDTLGAPVTMQTTNDVSLSFFDLMPRNDGLYALVDKEMPNDSTQQTVRRLSWSNISGPGTTVFTTTGPWIQQVAPSTNGVFATVAGEQLPETLARLNGKGGSMTQLRKVATDDLPFFVGMVDPWIGG